MITLYNILKQCQGHAVFPPDCTEKSYGTDAGSSRQKDRNFIQIPPLTQSSNPNENYKQQLTLFIFCIKIFLRLKRKFFLHACCPCQHRKGQSCSPFRLFSDTWPAVT